MSRSVWVPAVWLGLRALRLPSCAAAWREELGASSVLVGKGNAGLQPRISCTTHQHPPGNETQRFPVL